MLKVDLDRTESAVFIWRCMKDLMSTRAVGFPLLHLGGRCSLYLRLGWSLAWLESVCRPDHRPADPGFGMSHQSGVPRPRSALWLAAVRRFGALRPAAVICLAGITTLWLKNIASALIRPGKLLKSRYAEKLRIKPEQWMCGRDLRTCCFLR